MSGEFGQYDSGGYFWLRAAALAEDAEGGNGELTRLWGAFLRVFTPIAKEISWYEAHDSGYDAPVFATLEREQALRDALRAIEEHVSTYREVMRRAIREFERAREADLGGPRP